MDDSVEVALRRKKDSSMRVAIELVKAGEADAARPGSKPHAFPDAARAVPMLCNLGAKEGVRDIDELYAIEA